MTRPSYDAAVPAPERPTDAPPSHDVHVALPDWIDAVVDWARPYHGDDERMRLAIALSRENVRRGTGGPFGAAIFERESGRLVSVGVNSVVRLSNCTLHAEMTAFMTAQARLGTFSLGAAGLPEHELATSCAPCAMCLGATLWSGVKRVLCGATRDDAMLLRFDEGPVFAASWRYLKRRGIDVRHGVLREEAVAVFDEYRRGAGMIYNG